MAERGITEADILSALGNYTERIPTRKNSMRYSGRSSDRRRLKVWVRLPDNPSDDKYVKSVAWRDE